MTYTVDKKVPIPKRFGGKGAAVKYPWHELEVGDSFLVEGTEQRSVSSSAASFGSRNKMKFATRKEGNKTRVWRIE